MVILTNNNAASLYIFGKANRNLQKSQNASVPFPQKVPFQQDCPQRHYMRDLGRPDDKRRCNSFQKLRVRSRSRLTAFI